MKPFSALFCVQTMMLFSPHKFGDKLPDNFFL
jgi:hypothetical protein